MNNNLSTLWMEALADSNRDAFVADWATSSIWGQPEDLTDDQLCKIAEFVAKVWDGAHMSARDIVQASGMSQAKFASRFCIPKRTVENWCAGVNTPPDYLRFLLVKDLGLI